MKFLRYLLFCTLLVLSAHAVAQETGEWLGAEVEFDLPKKFSLEASAEARALNTGTVRFYKYLTQFGLNYKISKRFDVGFKYRLEWRLEEDMHHYYRNRMMFDFKFDYPIERFKFDYRARFQRITRTFIDNEFDLIPSYHFRNKFRLSYNVPNNPITPRVSLELFYPLNGYKYHRFEEYRVAAEARYPLTKKQSITGGIMYANERTEFRLSGIIFLLSYKINVG